MAVMKMNLFSEIYGAYFRIAAKLLESEVTDEKAVNDEVQRGGFRDSVLFLPQKLIPSESDWGLFSRMSDGRLKRITKKAPVKVLTKLQKMWLKAKLSDPKIRLFMDENLLSELSGRLADIPPLYRNEQFRFTDRFSDSDNFLSEDYIRIFRRALEAVKGRKIVWIEFVSGHGKQMSGKFVLLKMEYSPKNDKFRAYCFHLRHDRINDSGSAFTSVSKASASAVAIRTAEYASLHWPTSSSLGSPATSPNSILLNRYFPQASVRIMQSSGTIRANSV